MGASSCTRTPLRNESNFLFDYYAKRPGSSTPLRTCATTAQTSGYQNDARSNKTDERLSDLEISHPDEKEAALAFGAHAPGGQRPLVQTLVPVIEKRSSRSLRCVVARFRTRARYRTVSQSSLHVAFCCAQTPPAHMAATAPAGDKLFAVILESNRADQILFGAGSRTPSLPES